MNHCDASFWVVPTELCQPWMFYWQSVTRPIHNQWCLPTKRKSYCMVKWNNVNITAHLITSHLNIYCITDPTWVSPTNAPPGMPSTVLHLYVEQLSKGLCSHSKTLFWIYPVVNGVYSSRGVSPLWICHGSAIGAAACLNATEIHLHLC